MRRLALTRRFRTSLSQRMDRLALALSKANLNAFADLWEHPRRMLWLNFLVGLARGFGIALGLTLIMAVFLMSLTRVAALNLPYISRLIAELVQMVNDHLRKLPY